VGLEIEAEGKITDIDQLIKQKNEEKIFQISSAFDKLTQTHVTRNREVVKQVDPVNVVHRCNLDKSKYKELAEVLKFEYNRKLQEQ